MTASLAAEGGQAAAVCGRKQRDGCNIALGSGMEEAIVACTAGASHCFDVKGGGLRPSKLRRNTRQTQRRLCLQPESTAVAMCLPPPSAPLPSLDMT
jgi:hypothetical protein